MDCAKVFELPGGFEFVRETSVRIERLRGERTIHFGDFVRFLVLVDPDDLRTHRNHEIAWAEFEILDCDRIGASFARAGRGLCRVQSAPGREQGGDGYKRDDKDCEFESHCWLPIPGIIGDAISASVESVTASACCPRTKLTSVIPR